MWIIFQKVVSHGAKLEINFKNNLNRGFETIIIRELPHFSKNFLSKIWSMKSIWFEINFKNEFNRSFETMIIFQKIRGLFFKKFSLVEQNLKSISKMSLIKVSKRWKFVNCHIFQKIFFPKFDLWNHDSKSISKNCFSWSKTWNQFQKLKKA